jgi:hypothetical protein
MTNIDVAPLADEQQEFQRRFVLIVAAAAKDDVVDRRRPAGRIGHHVVKLQTSAFSAPTRGADECALPLIAARSCPAVLAACQSLDAEPQQALAARAANAPAIAARCTMIGHAFPSE